jgi:hypothetical protein
MLETSFTPARVFQCFNPLLGLSQLNPEKGSDLLEKGLDYFRVGFSRNLLHQISKPF